MHSPSAKPPIVLNANLKIQIFEFTYCNDRFREATTSCKLEKYDTLQPLLTQQGWNVLPPIIITATIKVSIHNPTIKHLINLKIPQYKINKLMEKIS